MITAFDAAYLTARARAAREAAAEAQSDRDFALSVRAVERAMADAAGHYRVCPVNACRRARRCAGREPICLARGGKPPLSPAHQREIIDDVYYDLQAMRMQDESDDRHGADDARD